MQSYSSKEVISGLKNPTSFKLASLLNEVSRTTISNPSQRQEKTSMNWCMDPVHTSSVVVSLPFFSKLCRRDHSVEARQTKQQAVGCSPIWRRPRRGRVSIFSSLVFLIRLCFPSCRGAALPPPPLLGSVVCVAGLRSRTGERYVPDFF